MYSRLRTRFSSVVNPTTSAIPSSSTPSSIQGEGLNEVQDSQLAKSETVSTEEANQLLTKQENIEKLRKRLPSPLSPAAQSFTTDSCLDRYLRARNYDIAKASKMLEATLAWREAYGPDLLAETKLEKLKFESSSAKMFVLPHTDENNRSIIVMRTGLENSRDAEGKVAYLVYTLERASRLAEQAGGEQYVVIVDYTVGELSMSTLPGISVMKETTNILQGHYPERLSCMILVQAPRLFHSMFKIIRPLIDAKTKSKIHFVQTCHDVANIPGIDRAALPLDFGGENSWQFSVDDYFAKETKNNTEGGVDM